MSRVLAFTVFVTDPDTKRTVGFTAGTTPPDWAADMIRNPRAWVTEPEPELPEEFIDVAVEAISPTDELVAEVADDDDGPTLGQKPLDTVTEIKAWVGADAARAADALTYETDGDDPRPGSGQNRPTLIAALAAVIGD